VVDKDSQLTKITPTVTGHGADLAMTRMARNTTPSWIAYNRRFAR
jgi:hypothetical protein